MYASDVCLFVTGRGLVDAGMVTGWQNLCFTTRIHFLAD